MKTFIKLIENCYACPCSVEYDDGKGVTCSISYMYTSPINVDNEVVGKILHENCPLKEGNYSLTVDPTY